MTYIATALRRKFAILACLFLVLSMRLAVGERDADCLTDLLKCARDTKVSTLEFGLQKMGDQLHRQIVRHRALGENAIFEYRTYVIDGKPQLSMHAVNTAATCKEIRSLIVYEIWALSNTEGLYKSDQTITEWKEREPSYEVRRKACQNIAGFLLPFSYDAPPDKALFELCEQMKIELLVTKIDPAAKPPVRDVKHCMMDIAPAE